jgi:hypothetical protein
MERQLVVNMIQTPDGTMLQSHHRHDFKTYIDQNGSEYMVDGGLEYLRRNDIPEAPYIERSLYSDDSYELIRKYHSRGGRGKDGKQPLTWVPLCEMSDDWLKNCIEYNLERNLEDAISTILYQKELDYRKNNYLYIPEQITEIHLKLESGYIEAKYKKTDLTWTIDEPVFLEHDPTEIVYIAHPISGDIKGNLEKIKQIIRDINLTEANVVPFAHYWVDCHALDDDNPQERERGIKNDIALMKADFITQLWLYGPRISKGMLAEVKLAEELGIPVYPMTTGTEFDYLQYLHKKEQ